MSFPNSDRGKRVTGEDCVVVFIVPFGTPTMKEAIDQAIENAGPEYDALIDGVVYRLNHSFLIGQQCFRIEGTPINTKNSVSLSNEVSILRYSKYNP